MSLCPQLPADTGNTRRQYENLRLPDEIIADVQMGSLIEPRYVLNSISLWDGFDRRFSLSKRRIGRRRDEMIYAVQDDYALK